MSAGAQLLQAAWANSALPWIKTGADIAHQRDALIAESQAKTFDGMLKALQISSNNATTQAELNLKAAHLPIDQQNADTERMFAMHKLGGSQTPIEGVSGGVFDANGKPIEGATQGQPNTQTPALPQQAQTQSPEQDDPISLKTKADANSKLQYMLAKEVEATPDKPVGEVKKQLLDRNAEWEKTISQGLVTNPQELIRTKQMMEEFKQAVKSLDTLDPNASVADAVKGLQADYQDIIGRSRQVRGLDPKTGAAMDPSESSTPSTDASGGPGLLPPAEEPKTRTTPPGQNAEIGSIKEGQAVIYPDPSNRSVKIRRAGGALFMSTVEVAGKDKEGKQIYKTIGTEHPLPESMAKAQSQKPSLMNPADVSKIQGVELLPEGKAAITYVDKGKDAFKTIIVPQSKQTTSADKNMTDPEKAAYRQATTIMNALEKSANNPDSEMSEDTKRTLRGRIAAIAAPLVAAHPVLKSVFDPYMSGGSNGSTGLPSAKTQLEVGAGVLRILKQK